MSEPKMFLGCKVDERPKRGWWAPGSYINHCSICLEQFIGDKRAGWCATCAYAKTDEELSPKPPEASGTERSVCLDIAARQQKGIAKYGVTVADNPLSLREWLQHAYEETLDNAVYLKRAIEEIANREEGAK